MTVQSTTRATIHADRIVRHTASAVTLLMAGSFQSEARRKEALTFTSRAYEALRSSLSEQLISDFPADADGDRAHPFEELYWTLPMELHLWRPKHTDLFKAYPEHVAQAVELTELRAAIKATMVEPKPAREDHPLLTFARTAGVDLTELRRRRDITYRDALDLGRKLGGLPVSVQRVFCVNQGGTHWVRLDWYLAGERKPFGIIAAAYDRLVREGAIKEAR